MAETTPAPAEKKTRKILTREEKKLVRGGLMRLRSDFVEKYGEKPAAGDDLFFDAAARLADIDALIEHFSAE